MNIPQILNMSRISRTIFDEICLYHEIFKEIKLYREAISSSIEEIVEKPITKLEPAIKKTNEIVLMIAQMLACSSADQDSFKKEVLIGVGEHMINEYKPTDPKPEQNLVTDEKVTEIVTKKLEAMIQPIKDQFRTLESGLCTRIHGVFEANAGMTLPQFAQRWLKYRTHHELRVSPK